MPTPASLAIASSVTSGPSWENARTAASSSRSRLRRASARSGRPVAVTAPPRRPSAGAGPSGDHRLASGGSSAYSRERSGGSSASHRTGWPPVRDTEPDGKTMTAHALITTPFTAESTAAEVVAGIDLTGRRAIVTGGASGIGVETARALAGAGAEVTLAVRNLAAGERTAADIIATTGNKQVLVAPLDLADQASVAAFVAGVGRPAAHPGQQRRRDGVARDAHAGGLGAAVRHQPPRPLRARHRPAPRAGRGRRGARRVGQLAARTCARRSSSTTSTSASAGVRAVGRLRAVQDRQRAVRGRGDEALGRATASPSTR